LRFNSHGDFIHDWSWAAAYQQMGRAYYPKLLNGLPHTPAAGPRLLVSPGPDAPAIRRALIDGVQAPLFVKIVVTLFKQPVSLLYSLVVPD